MCAQHGLYTLMGFLQLLSLYNQYKAPSQGVYKLMHSENIHLMHTLRLGFSGLSGAMVTKNWWIDECKEGKLSLSDKSCSSVQLRFF